jgi:immune inhibitor A
VQAYDSTFGLSPTDVVCLHLNSVGRCYGNLAPNPMFDDTQSYGVAPNSALGNFGWATVPVPTTGTTVSVTSISAHDEFMQVVVAPK